jgi:hypothetical protein
VCLSDVRVRATFATVLRYPRRINPISASSRAWLGTCAVVLAVACDVIDAPPTAAQVQGHVVDSTGRSLPFVVVVSRTRNGFLAQYTDLDGRFAFPGRPHRSGDELTFQAIGYRTGSHRLRSGRENVTHVMEATTESDGWMIGLVAHPEVQILDANGQVVSTDSLVINRRYRINVTWTGMHTCSEPGPAVVGARDDGMLVAVAEFVRSEDCDGPIISHSQTVEHMFAELGPATVTVRGRRQDLERSVIVVESR